MNVQFKKGVLELLVLLLVHDKDMYGYEGTIYPLLKRLTNEKYFETYLKESTEGPPRKYYHITVSGITYVRELEKEWLYFSGQINKFIEEGIKNED